jgi:polyribonucleotide nucleotidyltransferase
MITLISAIKVRRPNALAALAASAALSISDIPFAGRFPSAWRIDGRFQINPKTSDLARADMDLMVGATADSVCMVEDYT